MITKLKTIAKYATIIAGYVIAAAEYILNNL